MKKRGGARKRIGRPRLPKPRPEPAAQVDESAVMTLHEVADYLHCHRSTVLRLLRERKIPGFKMGGSWRFLKSDVDQWIAQGGGRR